MRTYELLAIVQPDLEEKALNAVVDSIKQVMLDNGGEILFAEVLGKRRFAYVIKRRLDGFYVLVQANLEPAALIELERMLKLSEDVLRHLLVRMDEIIVPRPMSQSNASDDDDYDDDDDDDEGDDD